MKKSIIIVVVLIVLVAGYLLIKNNQAKAPMKESNQNTQQAAQNAQTSPEDVKPSGQTQTTNNPSGVDYTPSTNDAGGEAPAPNIQVVEVDYDGTSFTPSTVNIKVNDWVFFKNKSTLDMWPASNPHPTHTIYPEFDAKKAIAPGAQYKFQFTKVGSWGYHNHLNPSATGTINVTK